MVARKIVFYRTDAGRCPIEDFLDSLSPKAAQKVAWVLRLVKELEIVPSQYFKKLTDTEQLWECRVEFRGNIYRMFAFFERQNVVILTHGFAKKTPKTPEEEIRRAAQLRAHYLRRRS